LGNRELVVAVTGGDQRLIGRLLALPDLKVREPQRTGTERSRLIAGLIVGLAACPSHDVAFDTGMLTVSADLKIQIGRPLADAARGDHLTRQCGPEAL
jgi:putative restriction endonuclease